MNFCGDYSAYKLKDFIVDSVKKLYGQDCSNGMSIENTFGWSGTFYGHSTRM